MQLLLVAMPLQGFLFRPLPRLILPGGQPAAVTLDLDPSLGGDGKTSGPLGVRFGSSCGLCFG